MPDEEAKLPLLNRHKAFGVGARPNRAPMAPQSRDRRAASSIVSVEGQETAEE